MESLRQQNLALSAEHSKQKALKQLEIQTRKKQLGTRIATDSTLRALFEHLGQKDFDSAMLLWDHLYDQGDFDIVWLSDSEWGGEGVIQDPAWMEKLGDWILSGRGGGDGKMALGWYMKGAQFSSRDYPMGHVGSMIKLGQLLIKGPSGSTRTAPGRTSTTSTDSNSGESGTAASSPSINDNAILSPSPTPTSSSKTDSIDSFSTTQGDQQTLADPTKDPGMGIVWLLKAHSQLTKTLRRTSSWSFSIFRSSSTSSSTPPSPTKTPPTKQAKSNMIPTHTELQKQRDKELAEEIALWIAECYAFGVGVGVDKDKAVEWYRRTNGGVGDQMNMKIRSEGCQGLARRRV
jgi:TPR repeat protein